MSSLAEKKYYTNFLPKQKLFIEIKAAAKDLIDFYDKEIIADDLLPVGVADGYHFINFIAKECKWKEITRKLFVQCFVNSEQRQRCSGFLAVYLLACRLINKTVTDVSSVLVSSAWVSNKDALKSLSKFQNIQMTSFFESLINEIGILGKLKIEKTSASIPTLELCNGHKFLVGLDSSYIAESIKSNESKIILFDGAVELASQIDHLFTKFSESNESCIIVARKFGNDVLSTINVNKQRNTLNVFPVKIIDSIENINMLGDIAVCSGGEIIDESSGKRLSQINVSDLTTVTNIKINGSIMQFDQKPELEFAVSKRISAIKEKIQLAQITESEMSPDDIRKVYGGRLSALISNYSRLWVPEKNTNVEFVSRSFMFSLEYISAFANTGAVKTSDILAGSHDGIPDILPANIVDSSIAISKSMHQSLVYAGGCIAIQ